MRELDTHRATLMAQDFLRRSFAPEDSIALLLRRHTPARATQRIILLREALTPRYLGWLTRENIAGANIYVAANPLLTGSRQRTKESIALVRHLYLDIDADGETRLAALMASDAVPTPTAILSTSPSKYQILWRVEGFDFGSQERTLKALAIAFGGDPACTDCNRVLRVPGFLNRKYDPAPAVGVQHPCNTVWNPADFRLDIACGNPMLACRPIPPKELPRKHTNSETDWAWVLQELACGKDPLKLTAELASRRFDKACPLYYAQRTVDVASARLLLLDGMRMDDVIRTLEVRRRCEISSALCSARACEIALTAQRMITRKRSA
jgi:hypothetical protein